MASNIKLLNQNGKTTTISSGSNTTDITLDGSKLLYQVDTIADLRALNETPSTIYCSGYHTKDDNAFGNHFFKRIDTAGTDNGGTIIVPTGVTTYHYALQYNGSVSVKWFGAKGDGITDDTDAIQRAINIGNTILFENKKYYLTKSTLEYSGDIQIIGNNSTIKTNFIGVGLKLYGTLKFTTGCSTDYQSFDNYIVLDNVLGIENGDLLNIISTDLYHTSRLYYFKGGNVKVTKIIGNNVYIDTPLPFDITASTITIKVYKPNSIGIDSLNILKIGTPLYEQDTGLLIEHSSPVYIKNVMVENFDINFDIKRCVDVITSTIKSGTGLTYGFLNNSSTNVLINGTFKTGNHGVAHGGQEPIFKSKIENSSISNETIGFPALDAHQNTYTLNVENSDIDSFGVTGNVTFKKCTIKEYSGYNNIGCAEESDRANYVFNDIKMCDFGRIRVVGYSQTTSSTPNVIGSIVMDRVINKSNITILDLDYEDTAPTATKGDINLVVIRNSENIGTGSMQDNIDRFEFDNSFFSNSSNSFMVQTATSGKIKRLKFNEGTISNRYNNIVLYNFDYFCIDGTEFIDIGSASTGIVIDNSTAKISLINTDLSNLTRGLSILNLDTLLRLDSNVTFFGTPTVTNNKVVAFAP